MAASGSKSMSSVHQRRGAPSQGKPNGGELDEGPILPERGQSDVSCVN